MRKIPFKEFKRIYSRMPRLCVEVILKDRRGLLLTRRTIDPANGYWHTPGGTVLKGESLAQTVQRVAHDELGRSVKIKKMLGVIEYHSFKNHYSQDISIAFLVENKSAKTFDLDSHADAYGFFKVIPRKTIKEQRDFCCKHLNMRAK